MISKQQMQKYTNNGFLLLQRVISQNDCNELKKKALNLKSKLFLPFSKTPLGFGDIKNRLHLKTKSRNAIFEISNELCETKLALSHFCIVNKAAWIGPDVEWHQEVFNSDIYAPGINMKLNWKKFIQVFIALDDHDEINGCLRVFNGSHKNGILPYQDIVNINGSHKRRVDPKSLDKLYNKFKVVDIKMKKGDVLFFNHLLVHGSPTNMSHKSRISGLMQFYDPNLNYNYKVFEKYQNFRAKFIKLYYEKKIKSLSNYKNNLQIFSKN